MSRGSLGRYLKSVLRPKRIGEQTSKSEASYSEAGQSEENPFFIKAVSEAWHSEEAAHRQLEKSYWKRSFWLSGGTAVVALIGAGLAYSAFLQYRRQADAADEQTEIARRAFSEVNRPWLAVKSARIEAVAVAANKSIIVMTNLTVANVGHSPVIGLKLYAAIVPSLEAVFDADYAQKYCGSAILSRTMSAVTGDVILPEIGDQHRSYPVVGSIPEIVGNYKIAVGKASGNKSDVMKSFEQAKFDISLSVVGCFTYKNSSAYSNEVHVSGFSFAFGPTNKPGFDTQTSLAKTADYSARDMSVSGVLSASYAD